MPEKQEKFARLLIYLKSEEFFGEEGFFKRKPVYAKSERRETCAEREKGIRTTN